jgi:UMF1 family MFS transporter
MYDWANSAFATTLMTALFPPFYRALVLRAGLPTSSATAYWGYTAAIALLVMAFIDPVLGAISDYTGGKKRYAGVFVGVGVAATASFLLIGESAWSLASVLYIVATIGFSGSILFYESLLPHIATRGDIDQVSARGYAMGYVGGGLLLLINTLWVTQPSWFGMPSVDFAIRASFFSVAVWWGLFAIPFFRRVPEPPIVLHGAGSRAPVREGISRVAGTFREIRRYRELFLFLVAFWIYSDGIGTMIRMATAYGDEIGIGLSHMVIALVITQFVGAPSTLAFGSLARRIGAKSTVLITLAGFFMISVGAYFMRSPLHFYILASSVGLIQGGCSSLSRSLYGAMVPKHRAAEFFGFFSASSKFAGIVGPIVFGVVSQVVGHSRLSIVSLVLFFLAGAAVLSRVRVEEGMRIARDEEFAEARSG